MADPFTRYCTIAQPARLEKPGTVARTAGLVGRTPWSAADALVGLLAPCKMLMSLFGQRDGGVPRGPGGSAPPIPGASPRSYNSSHAVPYSPPTPFASLRIDEPPS